MLDLESYRKGLTGYCYRMLGSIHDADDVVQDTMLRAWRGQDQFLGQASVRTWLYQIATNLCIDTMRKRRRHMPMDLSGPYQPDVEPGEARPAVEWIEPALDRDVLPDVDPVEAVVLRASVRLAFIAVLQHLPARQRAILILRDVLGWHAREVADLLAITPTAANSALSRARASLGRAGLRPDSLDEPEDVRTRELLKRYVKAFEGYDIEALVALLHDEASMSMPPLVMWFKGRRNVRAFHLGTGAHCRGARLIPVSVNGSPGFAQYIAPDSCGRRRLWAVQVLDIREGLIVHVHNFLDPSIFERFGLPLVLEAPA